MKKKTFVDSSKSLPFQKYHTKFEHINLYTKLLFELGVFELFKLHYYKEILHYI